MSIRLSLVSFLFLFVIVSCTGGGSGSSTYFYTLNVEQESYYQAAANLYFEGEYCKIYVERDADITRERAQDIANEFDAFIYEPIVAAFGEPIDVDSDNKLILFLLDIKDGFTGTNSYINGFFDPAHLYSRETVGVSNEKDMLFLDIYPTDASSPAFYSIIAHELQHLINYSNTVLVDNRAQDLWINEGLSAGAEFVYSGEINENRVLWFNADPLSSIRYGNNFFVWNGAWEQSNSETKLDNYATVSLFFQWLRIHSSIGTGIYREILNSDYRDYQAVTAAAATRIDAGFNTWSVLMGTWQIANLLCEDAGYYGYNQELSVSTQRFSSVGNEDWPFSPGEGIVSQMPVGDSNTPPASGPNIEYIGIDSVSGVADYSSPYEGDYSLVFNSNSDNEGADETGYIANVDTPLNTVLLKSAEPSHLPLESRGIDAHIQLERDSYSAGSQHSNNSSMAFQEKMRKIKELFDND